MLASLKQIQFDAELSDQIVFKGLERGYFTQEQNDFVRVVATAKGKGISDKQVAAAALASIEREDSSKVLGSVLGVSTRDLANHGPQRGTGQSTYGMDSKGRGNGVENGGIHAGDDGEDGRGGGVAKAVRVVPAVAEAVAKTEAAAMAVVATRVDVVSRRPLKLGSRCPHLSRNARFKQVRAPSRSFLPHMEIPPPHFVYGRIDDQFHDKRRENAAHHRCGNSFHHVGPRPC